MQSFSCSGGRWEGACAVVVLSAALVGACSGGGGGVTLPSIATTISLPTAGASTISIDEQRNRVYVGAVNKIFVIDGSADTTLTSITLDTGGFGTSPVVDASTSTIYAANSNGTLSVIDGATYALQSTLQLAPGSNLTQAVVNTKTHKLYAANYQTAILVVDLATLTLASTIPNTDSNFLAVNQTANKVYVTGYDSGTVAVIDGAADQIASTVHVGKAYTEDPDGGVVEGSGSGPDGIVVNEATNAIYVANQTDGTFVTVDARAETVTRSVPATLGGSGLFWVDASRRAPYAVYATNFLDNTLTVFERNGTVAGRLSLGAASNSASGVAVNSTTGKIYVVDFGDSAAPDGGYNTTPDSSVIVLR